MSELPWAQVRLGALVLLAVYLAAALIALPREAAFLRSVEMRVRRLFILQDVLVTLGVLGVLVPTAAMQQPRIDALWVILGGFVVLWVGAVWAAIARYSYTYHVLLGSRGDISKRLRDAIALSKKDSQSKEVDRD